MGLTGSIESPPVNRETTAEIASAREASRSSKPVTIDRFNSTRPRIITIHSKITTINKTRSHCIHRPVLNTVLKRFFSISTTTTTTTTDTTTTTTTTVLPTQPATDGYLPTRPPLRSMTAASEQPQPRPRPPRGGTCVICHDPIIGWGHNARPLADGRCCDDCNVDVITSRINVLKELHRRGEIQ